MRLVLWFAVILVASVLEAWRRHWQERVASRTPISELPTLPLTFWLPQARVSSSCTFVTRHVNRRKMRNGVSHLLVIIWNAQAVHGKRLRRPFVVSFAANHTSQTTVLRLLRLFLLLQVEIEQRGIRACISGGGCRLCCQRHEVVRRRAAERRRRRVIQWRRLRR